MNARNPNRTTKAERRFVRRYNPYAARVLGVAAAARWYRKGVLLDEARGLDNLINDVKYGMMPLDLNERVKAALNAQRDAFERKFGMVPGALTPTSSNVNHFSGGATGHTPGFVTIDEPDPDEVPYPTVESVTVEPDGWINLKYRQHISFGIDVHQLDPGAWQELVDATRREPASLTIPESIGGGTLEVHHRDGDTEPLGPSECGHYEVVETAISMDSIALTPETIARLGLGDYADWDGNPWHDTNEVAAMRAEVIERELNDDINPGE